MAVDALANFAYSTVATAPSPATSGTSLVVAAGDGAKMPTVPFNATVWATGANAISTNAEIVRVTAISTDTLTITRAQESSTARTVVVGDQIAATITKKTFTDIEGSLAPLTTRGDFLTRDASNNIRIGPTVTGHTLMFDGTDSVAKIVRAHYDAGVVVSNTATLTTVLSTTMQLQTPHVVGDQFRLLCMMRYLNNSGVNQAPTIDVRIGAASIGVLSVSPTQSTNTLAHNLWLEVVMTIISVSATGTVGYAALEQFALGGAQGWAAAGGSTVPNNTNVGQVTVATNTNFTVDVLVQPGANANCNWTPQFISLSRLPKL